MSTNENSIARDLKISFTIDVDCGLGDAWKSDGRIVTSKDALISQGFEKGVHRFLSFMDEIQAKGTIFIVAGTAQKKEHKSILREAEALGHEIGSHTVTHQKDFGRRCNSFIYNELSESKAMLEDITGVEVVGFRGPGYFIDESIYKSLSEIGYSYSSTVNPSIIYSIIKYLFGIQAKFYSKNPVDYPINWRNLFASNHPTLIACDNKEVQSYCDHKSIVEVPVSCDRLRLVPAVSTFLDVLIPVYFSKILLLQLANMPSSTFVFHDMDFLRHGDFEDSDIPFLTDLSLSKETKKGLVLEYLKEYFKDHKKCTLVDQVKAVNKYE